MSDVFGISPVLLFGQLTIGLINGSFYAMMSLGVAIIFGMLRIGNFVHGAQYMLGAFGAWYLLHLPDIFPGLGLPSLGYWWALGIVPIVVAAIGAVTERLFIRRVYELEHAYGLLLTVGLAMVIEGLFNLGYGAAGQQYGVPDELKGGIRLGFMYLPIYRAWVIGAALVISCGLALATSLFAESLRPRVLGAYALIFSFGSVLGPSVGGALLAAFGWEAVFWFRCPIALLALLLLRDLPAPPRAAVREPFDLLGAVLLAGTIASLLLAINRLHTPGLAAALLLLFLAVLAGFLWRSRTAPRPVMALHVFRLPGFALLNASNALVNLAGFAVLLLVPYYLSRIAALPVMLAGLVLASSALGSMLVSLPGGWLLGRIAAPRLAVAGMALVACGLALIACWGAQTGVALLVFSLLLHGAGLGLLQVSYTDFVTATLPRQDRGVAGSLTMMTRTLGVVSAASLLTLLFGQLEAQGLAGRAGAQGAFLHAFSACFAVAAALAAAPLWPLWRQARRMRAV